MPNHWHLVLWPERDGELAAFLRWLTLTHASRWQRHRHCVGHGHVYQGWFKSFPVGDDNTRRAVNTKHPTLRILNDDDFKDALTFAQVRRPSIDRIQ